MTDALEQRVARLERENRQLKRIGLCIITAVAVAVLAGARLPESGRVVEAERFILRDKDGVVRAEWTAPDERASLAFINAKGTKLLSLGARNDNSCWLSLRDEQDKGGIGIQMTDAGLPQLSLSHSDYGHMYLSITPERKMDFHFLNKARRGVLGLWVNDDGQFLTIGDDDSNGQINLQVHANGSAAAGVTDHAGTPQIELFVGQDRQPRLKWEGQDVGRLPAAP